MQTLSNSFSLVVFVGKNFYFHLLKIDFLLYSGNFFLKNTVKKETNRKNF